MYTVAFCDDDMRVLETLNDALSDYIRQTRQLIRAVSFQSPLELMQAIERGQKYDVLFLDILMPGETGIDAAAEIRRQDENIKIIFLTSTAEYAVQSYRVGAFYYQLKPIQKTDFFGLMDSVLATCKREKESTLFLRCKEGICRIVASQVEYCEVLHRTLILHMSNGKSHECSGTLDELYEKLALLGRFLRPHRSFIVNIEYIQSITFRSITMSSGTDIPVPRGKYNELKDALLDSAFDRTIRG